MEKQEDITGLLLKIKEGDRFAYDKLIPAVYDQLKDIASTQLDREYSGHTFSKTALVHETYLRLIDQTRVGYKDRSHFYGIAARCMRQILVDYARKKKAAKRGGESSPLPLDEHVIDIEKHANQIIKLDGILAELSDVNERFGKIVELRFFAGLSIAETANMLDISPSTAKREWIKARVWLYHRLK